MDHQRHQHRPCRRRRPSVLLPAVLAVALPLVGSPLAVTAGVLLGGAVHRAVPAATPPAPWILLGELGSGVARTYAR